MEQLLEIERERVAAAHRKADESHELSLARLAARDADVERVRLECEQRVAAAKAAAEERIKAVVQRHEPELLEVQQRLEAFKTTCHERLDLEERRKVDTEVRAKEMEEIAVQREGVDEERRRLHEKSVVENWEGTIKAKAQREADTCAWVDSWHAADDLQKESEAKSAAIRHREDLATKSLGQAAHVLGHYYACQRQYTPTVDNKVSSILSGALHPNAPKGEAPSARALPPPPGSMALHAPRHMLGKER